MSFTEGILHLFFGKRNLGREVCKWNTNFHWEVSTGKTGLPLQDFRLFRNISSGTSPKVVFHLHPNRNFWNFLVNGKLSPYCSLYFFTNAVFLLHSSPASFLTVTSVPVFWTTLKGLGRNLVESLDFSAVSLIRMDLGVLLLGKIVYFHSASLSTQVYKWVPASLMLGVTLRCTSIPTKERRIAPSHFMLQKPG